MRQSYHVQSLFHRKQAVSDFLTNCSEALIASEQHYRRILQAVDSGTVQVSVYCCAVNAIVINATEHFLCCNL